MQYIILKYYRTVSCIDWYVCINLNYSHTKGPYIIHTLLVKLKIWRGIKKKDYSPLSLPSGMEKKQRLKRQIYSYRSTSSVHSPPSSYLCPCFRRLFSENEVNWFPVWVRLNEERNTELLTDTWGSLSVHPYHIEFPVVSSFARPWSRWWKEVNTVLL